MVRKKSNTRTGNRPKSKIKNAPFRHAVEQSHTEKIESCHAYSDNYPKKYFAVGLLLAFCSIVWKLILIRRNNPTPPQRTSLDAALSRLWQSTCQEKDCDIRNVHSKEGSFLSGRRLERGTKVVEIPRHMQIWILDAFRDDFVRTDLLGARHFRTNEFLEDQAFLAAYVAILIKRNDSVENPFNGDGERAVIAGYLETLPTYSDYRSHHPVAFDLDEIEKLYDTHSQIYFLISKRKEEIKSEYEAFTLSSKKFGTMISYEDYVTARLNVQTRAFEAGVLSTQNISDEEVELYRTELGIGIDRALTAMVPVLDVFPSNNKRQNIDYKFDPETNRFHISARKTLKKGTQLFGGLADRSDLFPTYGLVSGDFSERSSARLGSHRIVDVRVSSAKQQLSAQKNEIIAYLQPDDGYKECVTADDTEAMKFKELKRNVLLSVVNRYRNWIVSFPSLDRTTNSRGQMHISVDNGVDHIISTARLLALSHKDYDGNAFTVLQSAIDELNSSSDKNVPFDLEPGNDGLEYRAMVWVWRLASHGVNEYCGVYDEWNCSAAERSHLESLEENTKEWYASYVRHQEITALEILKEFAEQSYLEYTKTDSYDPESEEYFFRSTLCPIDSHGLKQLLYG